MTLSLFCLNQKIDRNEYKNMTVMLFDSKVPIFMELFKIFINNKSGDKYEKRKRRKKIL